jgi:hypothetical protein
MSRTPARPDAAPAASDLPNWMRWGGAGLTALLAVLFVVLLLQVRGQGQRLQALQDRIQSLENAQDLERTNALEEQLRSTVQRLRPALITDNVVAVEASKVSGSFQPYVLFLKAGGTLWGIGSNGNGQLGDGTTTARRVPVLIATGVLTISWTGLLPSVSVNGQRAAVVGEQVKTEAIKAAERVKQYGDSSYR